MSNRPVAANSDDESFVDDEGHAFAPVTHPAHLVRRLHQICISIFLSHSNRYGLTPIQFAALQAVEFSPGIDQSRLSRLIAVDRQTTSNVVNRLVNRGLLDRERRDKRTNALYLTGAARTMLEVMSGKLEEIDDTILGPLTPEERDTFMDLLARLVHTNNPLSRAPQQLDPPSRRE